MAEVKANPTDWFYDLFIEEAKTALDYHANKGTGGGSGGVAIKTCTVRFKVDTKYFGPDDTVDCFSAAYVRYKNGKREAVEIDNSENSSNFDLTLENVMCGSIIFFPYVDFTSNGVSVVYNNMGIMPGITDYAVSQLPSFGYNEPHAFYISEDAPAEVTIIFQ